MAEDKIEGSIEERRFGGVSRLYGPELRARFQSATVVVAGLGGVGS
jgi:tRNA A37 threonylcarbamoyladenosine dehydratase